MDIIHGFHVNQAGTMTWGVAALEACIWEWEMGIGASHIPTSPMGSIELFLWCSRLQPSLHPPSQVTLMEGAPMRDGNGNGIALLSTLSSTSCLSPCKLFIRNRY